MVARNGRNQVAPPLPRHLIGNQILSDSIANRLRTEEQNARCGIAIRRTIFRLNHGQIGLWRIAKQAGEINNDLGNFFAIRLRHSLLGPQVELCGDAVRGHRLGLTLYDGDASREAGLCILELVNGLLGLLFLSSHTTGDHPISGRHSNFHVGGKPAGRVVDHRKPTGGVEQIRRRLLQGDQLDAVNRRFFLPGKLAIVSEVERHCFALG